MTNLEEIKDDFAREKGYDDYTDFKNLTRKIDTDIVFVMDGVINEICKRYSLACQKELQKRIAESVKVNCTEDGLKYKSADGFSTSGYKFTVDKESITNEKLLVR